MRISFNLIKTYNTFNYNQNNRINNTNKVALKPLATDTVSFRGKYADAEPLKKLFKYGIPDLYSDIIILDDTVLKRLNDKNIFSQGIKTIVNAIKPYEKSLFPVEKKVYELLKSNAMITPNKKLDETLHRFLPEAQAELKSQQIEILEEILAMSKNLPQNIAVNVEIYIDNILDNLKEDSVIIPFDINKFNGELGNILKNKTSQKHKQIKEVLLFLTKQLNETKDVKKELKFRKIKNKNFKQTKTNSKLVLTRQNGKAKHEIKELRLQIIRQMKNLIESSEFKDDTNLKKIIYKAENQLNEVPIVYTFNRKLFIKDLLMIIENSGNSNLEHRLMQSAFKLPSPQNNVLAYITNTEFKTSEVIGNNLLNGSLGSIEHLVARNKGGKNEQRNYGLAARKTNSDKSNKKLYEELRRNPMIYVYAQKQFDKLIELSNQGILKKLGIEKSFLQAYANTLYKLSPEDRRLEIDLSALK